MIIGYCKIITSGIDDRVPPDLKSTWPSELYSSTSVLNRITQKDPSYRQERSLAHWSDDPEAAVWPSVLQKAINLDDWSAQTQTVETANQSTQTLATNKYCQKIYQVELSWEAYFLRVFISTNKYLLSNIPKYSSNSSF